MLGVLASEVGALRREQHEQLGDHGGDAGEVIAARGALQRARQLAYLDVGLKAGGVHFLGRRGPYQVDAFPRQQVEVAVEVARVGVQVGAVVELRRVHEDADRRVVALGTAGAHQREVAGVQGAHGGHQAGAAGDGAACRSHVGGAGYHTHC